MPSASVAGVPALDLPRIEAFMLWPDDDRTRAKVLDAAAARFVGQVAPRMSELPIGPDGAEVIGWLASVLPRDQVEELGKRRFCEGVVVGLFVLDCIREHRVTRAGIDPRPAKARALDRFAKLGRPCEMKNFDGHVWRPLRPAAHLWAAYAEETLRTGRDAFTDAARVSRFVEAANGLLSEGGSIKLARSRHHLLDPRTAWRLVPNPVN